LSTFPLLSFWLFLLLFFWDFLISLFGGQIFLLLKTAFSSLVLF
jgi:hypothetical protein